MIIIRMSGGLERQMFQYALYMKLTAMGREVKFDDINEYRDEKAKPIMLSVFGLTYPRATWDEINAFTDGSTKYGLVFGGSLADVEPIFIGKRDIMIRRCLPWRKDIWMEVFRVKGILQISKERYGMHFNSRILQECIFRKLFMILR